MSVYYASEKDFHFYGWENYYYYYYYYYWKINTNVRLFVYTTPGIFNIIYMIIIRIIILGFRNVLVCCCSSALNLVT